MISSDMVYDTCNDNSRGYALTWSIGVE